LNPMLVTQPGPQREFERPSEINGPHQYREFRKALPIAFPAPPGYSEPPLWTGRGFRVGQIVMPILSYHVGASGWTDELTEFHEDVAGEDHYIDCSSREHAVSRLERWLTGSSPALMDVGCSSGFVLKLLRKRLPEAEVVGADYVRAPLEKLSKVIPEVPLLQFDLVKCPLPDRSFDGIVCLNVLEHIENDFAAAQQLHRVLKPGGVVVIEVPAGPHLYDVYDKQLLHFRRYRMHDLVALLRKAGFEIIERSHLGFFLYPGFWVVKKRNQEFLRQGSAVQREIVRREIRRSRASRLMKGIMRFEARVRNWVYLPWGIRCLVTCRRPC
jgi:SAM-dependent methyltransferase